MVGVVDDQAADAPLFAFRRAAEGDLPGLIAMQEPAAVAGLAGVFPQAEYPFPRSRVLQRWREELDDPSVAVYVATSENEIVGFAARRGDELLHFGTALHTWGDGTASRLYAELLATFPADQQRLRLRVFTSNPRGRRFWEKHGWRGTGRTFASPFPPHPELLEYELLR